jgi:hypothetical protein
LQPLQIYISHYNRKISNGWYEHPQTRCAKDEALTASCESLGKRKRSYRGCDKCGGYFTWFVQVTTNLIKNLSGVSDYKVSVVHWGAVHCSREYASYTFEDWVKMKEEEYAALCKPTSCHNQNTLYIMWSLI